MGGTDETGVGHYDVTTELLGVPTALYVGEGSNFMLAAESAVYKVRVTEAATTGLKGLTAPLQIEVVYYAPTAIENLNTDINPEDPDQYRHNELRISDRYGKVVYHVKNYDTWAKNGQVYVGSNVFSGENVSDGVYYYTFSYKGKAKTTTWNGSITIVR